MLRLYKNWTGPKNFAANMRVEKGRKAVVIGHNLVKSPFAWDFSVDAQRASNITQNPAHLRAFRKAT